MRALLVGISQFDHHRLAVGFAEESDPDRQIVGRETRRHSDGRDENQESIEDGDAFVRRVRRGQSVFDKPWLMFHRFMNDRIQMMVRHHFQQVDRQLISSREILAVFNKVGIG